MSEGGWGTITVPQQIRQDEADSDGEPIKTGTKSAGNFAVVTTNRGMGIIGCLTGLRGWHRGRYPYSTAHRVNGKRRSRGYR